MSNKYHIFSSRIAIASAATVSVIALSIGNSADASLATVTTVLSETFDDANTNAGWTQTALQNKDRRDRFIHWSNGGTVTNPGTSGNAVTVAAAANAPAFSPTFTPGLDGSYKVSFDYFLGSSGEFSTNWTTVRLVNDAAPNGPSWGLLLGATNSTQSHPDIIRLLRNDGTGETEIASGLFDFGLVNNNGVSGLYNISLEVDSTLDTVEVFTSINGAGRTQLFNATDASDLVGLNQVRLTSAIANATGTDLNSQFFDNFVVQSNVPEPASFALLALGGLAMLGRRRSA